MSLLQRIKQHLLPPSSRSFHAFETNANSEMHQLRLENVSLMQQLAYMSDQLTQITEQVNQIQAEHAYEQQRDMMLFWAEYQKPSESPIAAKKRFFRSLPKVNICSFQGHCYCRRRPIALFDDYCGSRPPLLRIKATGC